MNKIKSWRMKFCPRKCLDWNEKENTTQWSKRTLDFYCVPPRTRKEKNLKNGDFVVPALTPLHFVKPWKNNSKKTNSVYNFVNGKCTLLNSVPAIMKISLVANKLFAVIKVNCSLRLPFSTHLYSLCYMTIDYSLSEISGFIFSKNKPLETKSTENKNF